MPRKLRLTIGKHPAIIIGRTAIKADKLVYVACANKRIHYRYGRSKILYFGTTKAGARRIASSAANKAEEFLEDYGVNELIFHVVTSNKIPGLNSWRLVERALIIRFREIFGEPPKGNVVGKRMKWNDELKYLTHHKLDDVIRHFQ
jgi:predicted GIY-YIG superfamily endonuclease